MKKIGTLECNIEEYLKWISDKTGNGSMAWCQYHWSKQSAEQNYYGKMYPNKEEESINFYDIKLSEFEDKDDEKEIRDAFNYLYDMNTWRKNEIRDEYEYMKLYNMKYELLYADKLGRYYIFTGIRGTKYLSIPTFLSNIEYFRNLDNLTVKEMTLFQNGQVGATESLAVTAGLQSQSHTSISKQINERQTQIEKKKNELDAQKDKMWAEIEAMKAEIEKQYQSKFELLYKKMDELKEMKEQLENQLFVVDSEIYAYRLRSGEVIQFHSLKTGKTKNTDIPVTIFPKLRFLDEELGKWFALYNFDGNTDDIQYFEDILKIRSDFVDLMCPSDKGVSFFKVSRDGIAFKNSEKFANQLEAYKKYHGQTIAVLIRNGESLWIAWTDENRIHVKGDDVFLKAKQTTVDTYNENESIVADDKHNFVSRYFLYNILQGILDKNELLPLPQKVNLLQPNDFIVISYAEGWLDTNPYGSLQDIVRKTNKPLQKGDKILSMSSITRDDTYTERLKPYSNDRGIGYANRTHDVHMRDCAIYEVNKIVTNKTYKYYVYEYPVSAKENRTPHKNGGYFISYDYTILQGPPTIKERWFDTDDCNKEISKRETKLLSTDQTVRLYLSARKAQVLDGYYENDVHHNRLGDVETTAKYIRYAYAKKDVTEKKHYYVSLEKSANWKTGRSARANFEFYEGECLNLTYMNTKYIISAIMHRDVYGRTNHSHTLPYLNKALDYLKKREEQEKEMLLQYTKHLPDDWMVQLSEWRMGHDYHVLTETRAKKFAKEFLR